MPIVIASVLGHSSQDAVETGTIAQKSEQARDAGIDDMANPEEWVDGEFDDMAADADARCGGIRRKLPPLRVT